MQDVTAITVVCNTPELFDKMYGTFRSFFHNMKLIVVDNSDNHSPARTRIAQLASPKTIIYQIDQNIGHGRGLDFAIKRADTKYVLIMDTDTLILKNPLPEMLAMVDDDTYGVGCITEVGKDGYDFGAFQHHAIPIPYLHPFFALIVREEYFKYTPFVHHGAPWCKTAVDLFNKKESHKLKHFNGLKAFDHAPDGKCIAGVTDYVIHDFGGTRRMNKLMGRDEIQSW